LHCIHTTEVWVPSIRTSVYNVNLRAGNSASVRIAVRLFESWLCHRLEVEVYIYLCKGLSCTTTCTCPPLPVKVLLSTQKQKQVPYYFYLIPQQQGLALPSTRTVPRNPLEQIQRIPFLAPTHASLQKHKGIPLVCSHRMQGIPHTHMLIS